MEVNMSNIKMLMQLSRDDFQKKYLGSFLGILWAFVQPTVTILIFWFVFQVGFKSAPVNDVPFILWLSTGLIPWFFFSDSVNTATSSIIENSFLVKKVVFNVNLLPIIKIVSALFIHLFFISIIFILFSSYGFAINVFNLQVIYYLIAMTFLVISFSWITSALVIFLKDISHLVGMLIQFGFWLTPIFWDLSNIPDEYKKFLVLNPMYYIIEGYRDSFINHIWFWDKPLLTLNFWIFSILLFFIGRIVFKKMRPHFADVL